MVRGSDFIPTVTPSRCRCRGWAEGPPGVDDGGEVLEIVDLEDEGPEPLVGNQTDPLHHPWGEEEGEVPGVGLERGAGKACMGK